MARGEAGGVRTRDGMLASVLRWLLAGVLLAAVLLKAAGLVAGREVRPYGGSGVVAVTALAVAGVAEAVCAALLVSGRIWAGALGTFVLGSLFGTLSLVVIGLGYPVTDCGCFGRLSLPVESHFGVVVGMMLGGRYLLLNGSSSSETNPGAGAVG